MRILQQAFRLYVEPDAFERTIAFYERAQAMTCERRVKIAETGIEAAKVGGFLIFAGSREKLMPVQHVVGIFYVDSLMSSLPGSVRAEQRFGRSPFRDWRQKPHRKKSGWPRHRVLRGSQSGVIVGMCGYQSSLRALSGDRAVPGFRRSQGSHPLASVEPNRATGALFRP